MGENSVILRFQKRSDIILFDDEKILINLTKVLRHIAPNFLLSMEIDLLVTSDDEMTLINRERRGIDKTTDVLSFPLYQKFPQIPHQMLGEIVISLNTLKKQALSIGHSDIDEFYRLLVHGILHLFGYDHETNEFDAVQMRKKEDECLELIFNVKHGS